ncbi:ClpXP protease specificity-enhancing factor [Halomonas urumqiensis]|uniref:ClpXP protease specificity-enhancing factor n=1 Tax=Halomonas urumqiensis TaxID=1684789 RepID=A0A2N7UGB7_9GAMM|nr:ClpXP protease specificity-enhancing factor [Halomonas urumqiensis]PMR79489.1 ClpXP protease specificity-enhancing factor [Halomonas urumqiensis]PTB01388.1 ClpXP protease specificity-enhancing factor [Halomonas urumqiensis]GHE22525.1 stringent starvation protein B [Halomonas urumqiensis]
MQSSRPYIARALYQWLLDNELTPYIVVDADQPGVEVPRQFVQNGQIVLNMAPTAVRDLFIENEALGFGARFGGKPMQVMVPTSALIAIYARENGVGMVFGHEPVMPMEAAESDSDEEGPSLSSVDADVPADSDASDESPDDDASTDKTSGASAPRKGKPSLRVIK